MVAHVGPRRLRELLDAVLSVGADLDLRAVLERIVQVAVDLVGARYGALGVLDESGTRLAEFITVGVDDRARAAIGAPPKGLGILGHVITHAEALRLADLSEHEGSVGFPPNHPPMSSFVGVPVRTLDGVFGNLYLTEKLDEEAFTDVDEELLAALATAAGIAIENARLYEQARRREAAIDAIGEINGALLAGTPTDDVLELLAERARAVVDADRSVILLPDDEDDGTLVVAVATGADAELLLGQRIVNAGGILGSTLSAGSSSVVIEDAADDPRAAHLLDLSGDIGPVLAVALVERRGSGTLCVIRGRGARPFGRADVEVMASLASQAGIALEHEQHRLQLGRLSVLEDQERIARDLHDSVVQRVFAAGLSLQAAAARSHDDDVRRRIEAAVDELDTVTRQIRSVIFDIGRRSPLADQGVRRRVLEITAEASRVLGFTPAVRFDGPVDTIVAEEVSEELLPTLREALSNVAHHAVARSVVVEVSTGPEGIVLRVQDDGAGLRGGTGGNGLANMRERAVRLGGDCTVDDALEGGTVVRWCVPVR